MVRRRSQIQKTLAENRESIVRFGVRGPGMFGKAARGESSSGSNLDFLVEFERKPFDAYTDFKEFLEPLLHCPVDLVLAEEIKPMLRQPLQPQAASLVFGYNQCE